MNVNRVQAQVYINIKIKALGSIIMRTSLYFYLTGPLTSKILDTLNAEIF